MIFFTKVPFLSFLKIVKIFEFLKKRRGTRLLLYEFSRGNQVDGSPRVAMEITFSKGNSSQSAWESRMKLKFGIQASDGDS